MKWAHAQKLSALGATSPPRTGASLRAPKAAAELPPTVPFSPEQHAPPPTPPEEDLEGVVLQARTRRANVASVGRQHAGDVIHNERHTHGLDLLPDWRVAPDRVISTVDPEARHTCKSKSTRRDGFRGHVCAEPETGSITDAELTSAAGEEGSDPVVGQQMIARDRFHRQGAAWFAAVDR